MTFGYGIRRPSDPYRLAAHDWTCARAIIALERDLPFSSAYIFPLQIPKIYMNYSVICFEDLFEKSDMKMKKSSARKERVFFRCNRGAVASPIMRREPVRS